MSSAHPFQPVSVKDYLESEVLAKHKREYVDGRGCAMAGAKIVHNRIGSRVLGQLHFAEVYAGIDFEPSEEPD